ncbi:MAG: hypothetical protein ACOC9Q_03535 [bacterium]
MIGGIISGIGSLFGGNEAAEAQEKAAKLQAKQQEANRELLRPAIEAGDRSRGVLEEALGLQGQEAQQSYYDQFQTDPGFQTAVDYGVDQLDRSAAARGMSMSGNQMQAVADFGQRSMYDAYQNRLGRLEALASGGQAQAGTLAGLNTQSAAQQGQHIGNAGFYQGAGIQNAANTVGNAFHQQGVLSAYGGGNAGAGGPGTLGSWQTNIVPSANLF